jgi:hypothetical protein
METELPDVPLTSEQYESIAKTLYDELGAHALDAIELWRTTPACLAQVVHVVRRLRS